MSKQDTRHDDLEFSFSSVSLSWISCSLGRINFRKHAANQLKQIPPEKEEEEEEEGEEEGQEENESPSDDTDEEDAEDPIVELDLEDAEQNKRLLSAEFLLIDVEVDREAMDEADEDTYAGITAEFCKVDFSIHKKDPSSGEFVHKMAAHPTLLPSIENIKILISLHINYFFENLVGQYPCFDSLLTRVLVARTVCITRLI